MNSLRLFFDFSYQRNISAHVWAEKIVGCVHLHNLNVLKINKMNLTNVERNVNVVLLDSYLTRKKILSHAYFVPCLLTYPFSKSSD